jgi:hypothetical protein
VAAQHDGVAEVARVAGLAGDRRRRIAEPVVVVLDGDDGRRAQHAHGAAPPGGERLDDGVEQQPDGVRPLGGIGQVAQREGGGELVGGEGGGGHGDPHEWWRVGFTPRPPRRADQTDASMPARPHRGRGHGNRRALAMGGR